MRFAVFIRRLRREVENAERRTFSTAIAMVSLLEEQTPIQGLRAFGGLHCGARESHIYL
jgi:hypothetical protein